MKNLKNLSVPAYLLPIAAAAAIVGLIVAMLSCSGEGLGMESLPWLAVLTVAVAVVLCAAVVSAASKGDKVVSTICIILGVVGLSFAIYLLVYGKAVVFGSVIFSDLERGDPAVVRASNLGVVSIALYLVSTLLTMIGAFFRLDKKTT